MTSLLVISTMMTMIEKIKISLHFTKYKRFFVFVFNIIYHMIIILPLCRKMAWLHTMKTSTILVINFCFSHFYKNSVNYLMKNVKYLKAERQFHKEDEEKKQCNEERRSSNHRPDMHPKCQQGKSGGILNTTICWNRWLSLFWPPPNFKE